MCRQIQGPFHGTILIWFWQTRSFPGKSKGHSTAQTLRFWQTRSFPGKSKGHSTAQTGDSAPTTGKQKKKTGKSKGHSTAQTGDSAPTTGKYSASKVKKVLELIKDEACYLLDMKVREELQGTPDESQRDVIQVFFSSLFFFFWRANPVFVFLKMTKNWKFDIVFSVSGKLKIENFNLR